MTPQLPVFLHHLAVPPVSAPPVVVGTSHAMARRGGGGGGEAPVFDESLRVLAAARRLPARRLAAMARICSTIDANGCPHLMTLIKQQTPIMPDA